MQQQQQLLQQKKASSHDPDKIEADDDIQEEIADDVDDLQQQQIALGAGGRPSKPGDPLTSSDNVAVSGGISSSGANAIDHSIDTL